MGARIAAALASLLWGGVTSDEAALVTTAGALFFTIPVAAVFGCQAGWRRRVAGVFAALLGAVGIAALALWLAAPSSAAGKSALTALGVIFALGVVGAPWLANALLLSGRRR